MTLQLSSHPPFLAHSTEMRSAIRHFHAYTQWHGKTQHLTLPSSCWNFTQDNDFFLDGLGYSLDKILTSEVPEYLQIEIDDLVARNVIIIKALRSEQEEYSLFPSLVVAGTNRIGNEDMRYRYGDSGQNVASIAQGSFHGHGCWGAIMPLPAAL